VRRYSEAPAVLVVHLKRFNIFGGKINKVRQCRLPLWSLYRLELSP